MYQPNLPKSGRTDSELRRRSIRSFRPALERLDQRVALTGGVAGLADPVGATQPTLQVRAVVPVANPSLAAVATADAARSPAFSVHFDRPIDYSSLSTGDFAVDVVHADGSRSPLPAASLSYLETGNGLDKTSSSLVISFLDPLDPGTYELFCAGGGALFGPGITGTDAAQVPIEQFTVDQQLAQPSQVEQLSDLNDPFKVFQVPVVANDMGATLNELVLAPGTAWTVTPDFGGVDPDHYRVALFDANQRLIATTEGADLGGLSQGLAGGKYFLQIYQTDGLDANSRRSIAVTVAGARLSSDALHVTSIKPVNANGLDANADSLLLSFSDGAINPDLLDGSKAVYTLTDGSGLAWSARAVGFDREAHQLLLGLAGPLPTGHYSLRVMLPPTSAASQEVVQVLGAFDNVAKPLAPDDLGTIFPTSATGNWLKSTTILPGQTVTESFSIVSGQMYAIHLSNPDVAGQLVRLTRDSTGRATSQVIGTDLEHGFALEPGIYQVVATNATPTTQEVAFAIAPTRSQSESLSMGGVGQIPANLNQSVLVLNASPVGSAQNFAAAASSSLLGHGDAPANPAADPSRGKDQPAATSSEPSGAFGVSLFIQTPIGALSSSPSGTNAAPVVLPATPTESVAGALQSTIFLNSTVATSDRPRPIGRQPASRPVAPPAPDGPAELPVSAADLQPAGRTLVDDQGPRSSTLTRSDSGDASPEPPMVAAVLGPELHLTPTAACLATADRPEASPTWCAEASVMPTELADVTSPVAVLVASCVLTRWIKTAQLAAGLPDLQRIKAGSLRALGRLREIGVRLHPGRPSKV